MRNLIKKIKKLFLLLKNRSGRIKIKRIIHQELIRKLIPLTMITRGYCFLKPRLVGIEPTNRCNLSCIMCARRYWNEEDNELGDMSIELFKEKILPFLSPVQTVNLQCFGEPLLGRYFLDMAKACKKKGCRVIFITNGTMLKKYAQEIVGLAIDLITVSIDGIKSFKRIRGAELELVLDGIREINLLKKNQNINYPEFSINFVAMKDNINELQDLVELAGQIGIKSINVSASVIHSEELFDQNIFRHIGLAEKYFDDVYNKAEKLGIKLNLPSLKEAFNSCYQPLEVLYINWNGDVRPCCVSTINEKNMLKLGNLDKKTIFELWNGSVMRKLRQALLKNKELPEFCRNCFSRVCSKESYFRIL